MAVRKKKAAGRKAAKRKTGSTGRKKKAAAKAAKRKAPRKATARKAATARKPAKRKSPARRKQIVGEGDYEASRSFLKDQAGFVKKNKGRIARMGKDAKAALEGPEGASLRTAEAKARSHSKAAPAGESMDTTEPGTLVIPPG
jgi:hypothetical protein